MFAVGKLARDQVADMAARSGASADASKRALAPCLP